MLIAIIIRLILLTRVDIHVYKNIEINYGGWDYQKERQIGLLIMREVLREMIEKNILRRN